MINQCIDLLSKISNSQLSRMILDEQYFNDIRTENFNAGENKGLIIAAFVDFLEDSGNEKAFNKLKGNNVQIDGEEEIKEILKDKEESEVEDFIEYLYNYKFFEA